MRYLLEVEQIVIKTAVINARNRREARRHAKKLMQAKEVLDAMEFDDPLPLPPKVRGLHKLDK